MGASRSFKDPENTQIHTCCVWRLEGLVKPFLLPRPIKITSKQHVNEKGPRIAPLTDCTYDSLTFFSTLFCVLMSLCVCFSHLSLGQLSPIAVREASVMLLQPDTQRICSLWHPRHRLTRPSSVICCKRHTRQIGKTQGHTNTSSKHPPTHTKHPYVCLTVQDCILMVVSSGQCFWRCFNAPSSSWIQIQKILSTYVWTSCVFQQRRPKMSSQITFSLGVCVCMCVCTSINIPACSPSGTGPVNHCSPWPELQCHRV